MMDGNMGSMMGWMMGLGLLGWVVVIALLVAILVLLVRVLTTLGSRNQSRSTEQQNRPQIKQ